ncbi:CpsD/CapB family tyrosine-protein kinase [Sporolactobacillus sp. Y61]|uniref:non-specific protein-tyrosine kinase n=1 Tax=Sporolactobacillus sp. Y61 TaxID=3160863 RepID=A0AAU8IJC2_9BACL
MKSDRKKYLTRLRLVTYFQKNSSYAEQYRTLRTNLNFIRGGEQIRSIVVTSAEAGEGKSTTASNLAIVMAQQGKRVLLIDADIRKPTLHFAFQKGNSYGLTTLLTGQQAFEDALQKTDIEQLSLLASGPVPPDPADLLDSEEMAAVIRKATIQFDKVILDSPPTLAVTDSKLIANLCDGLLLVVKSGATDIAKVQKAATEFSDVRAKFLGVVLNDQKLKRRDRDYYYYSTGS